MSGIKNFLLEQQEEEQDLLMCYLDWVEENQEVFQQLKETWVPVEGFPGYEVSDKGKVRSYHKRGKGSGKTHTEPKLLNPGYSGNQPNQKRGYWFVKLRSETGVYKLVYLHQLVCKTFHPNPNNHPLVLHRDDNENNNTKENLYWGTQQQNIKDQVKNNRRTSYGNKHTKNPTTWVLISPTGETHLTQNLKEFSTQQGLSQGCLSGVVCGKRNQHRGWTSLVCRVVL